MDTDLEKMLEVLEAEQASVRGEIAVLKARQSQLTKAAAGLRAALNPGGPTKGAAWGAYGRACEEILRSDPSREWTPREVHDRMIELGLAAAPGQDGRSSVRITLHRLVQRGVATRREDGSTFAYRWLDGGAAEDAADTATSKRQGER